jgi:prolipoprotein diacylglyceryltransferase
MGQLLSSIMIVTGALVLVSIYARVASDRSTAPNDPSLT